MGFEKSFEHSDDLYEAALAEFIANGYEQASINTILDTASMSKGQFYYHFKNKEGLYFALIQVLIARKRDFLASIMQPDDFQADIFTIFQTQIRYGLAFAQAHPLINQFAERFVKDKNSPIYQKAIARYNFEDDGAINNLIDLAYQNGDFRTDLPLPFIKSIIGYLFTHAAELADLNSAEEFETNLNHLIAFMKTGLASD